MPLPRDSDDNDDDDNVAATVYSSCDENLHSPEWLCGMSQASMCDVRESIQQPRVHDVQRGKSLTPHHRNPRPKKERGSICEMG
jgi:hypothetical protein